MTAKQDLPRVWIFRDHLDDLIDNGTPCYVTDVKPEPLFDAIPYVPEEKLIKAKEILESEFPEWKTCEHSFEPNTTMSYFRCVVCGIRPKTFEKLQELYK